MLKVANLTKVFKNEDKETFAIKNVNLDVKEREFLVIIGPSGCGKSTLLRIIGGLIPKTQGSISWDREVKIGFVFQNFGLFPYLTVFENIEFGLKMENMAQSLRKKKVEELTREVGLSGFEDKHPKELSGGMKQRVGIARSLAIQPDIMLLDEPFSSLDEFTAETLRALLLKVWEKRKITVIMITHLVREAIELSDRIAVMTLLPGSIEEIIDNNLPRPRSMRSKDFFALEDKLVKLVRG